MKKMNKNIRNILYGFLTWLIPFVSAFFFYSKEGSLIIDIFLFKTIMIVVGAIIGAFLLVLVPMSGMSVADYFTQIGLRYLVMPIMSIMVCAALANKK